MPYTRHVTECFTFLKDLHLRYINIFNTCTPNVDLDTQHSVYDFFHFTLFVWGPQGVSKFQN